jgi:sulfur-carrier protein adenylyltransferase/sulfurtransferase
MDCSADYYQSHSRLPFIGSSGQTALSKARVLVIGAGGLGCPCLTALAGAGIGFLGIADGDTAALSNLHRQPLYSFSDQGLPKALLAAEKLAACNPLISLQPHAVWADAENLPALVNDYDIIADCTDNFTTRYLINDICAQLGKPLVYGAIHQGEGHLTVFHYRGGPTLRCLFPETGEGRVASCAETGAYNITTAVTGNLMANEVIKIITAHPDVLSGTLLQLNVLEGTSMRVAFAHTAAGYTASLQQVENENAWTAPQLAARLAAGQPPLLVDIRDPSERDAGNLGGIHIPLNSLLSLAEFPFRQDKELLLYCQRGQRSRIAVQHLRAQGFFKAFHLAGGYAAAPQYLKLPATPNSPHHDTRCT